MFDRPETISIVREVIAKEGMQDRVSVKEGDWDSETFGSNNDVVLLSNVLHGAGSKAEMKLNKAYDSMADGGLLVIQEFLLDDQKTGPLLPALFNIMVGAYSRADLVYEVEKSGFIEPEMVSVSEKLGCCWITAKKP